VWLKNPFCAVYWRGRPTEDMMLSTTHAADSPWNESHFKDERFQVLLREARAELDESKRRAMYVELQRIVRDTGGTIVPMFANNVWAASDKIAHATEMASNSTLDGNRCIERWWFA
jgi:peptide/nickel transport system substrate-binding protein